MTAKFNGGGEGRGAFVSHTRMFWRVNINNYTETRGVILLRMNGQIIHKALGNFTFNKMTGFMFLSMYC